MMYWNLRYGQIGSGVVWESQWVILPPGWIAHSGYAVVGMRVGSEDCDGTVTSTRAVAGMPPLDPTSERLYGAVTGAATSEHQVLRVPLTGAQTGSFHIQLKPDATCLDDGEVRTVDARIEVYGAVVLASYAQLGTPGELNGP